MIFVIGASYLVIMELEHTIMMLLHGWLKHQIQLFSPFWILKQYFKLTNRQPYIIWFPTLLHIHFSCTYMFKVGTKEEFHPSVQIGLKFKLHRVFQSLILTFVTTFRKEPVKANCEDNRKRYTERLIKPLTSRNVSPMWWMRANVVNVGDHQG